MINIDRIVFEEDDPIVVNPTALIGKTYEADEDVQKDTRPEKPQTATES